MVPFTPLSLLATSPPHIPSLKKNMVGSMQEEVSAVTFSVTCELVSTQHVRLVQRKGGQWDYVGGTVLEGAPGSGADLSGMAMKKGGKEREDEGYLF